MESEEKLNYKRVGQRIKERRRTLRITQGHLAKMINISYQQVQKYETGINQLSLGRLLQFAKALNAPAEYFYKGIELDFSIGMQKDSDIIQRTRSRPVNILLVEDNTGDALLFSNVIKEFEHQVMVHYISDAENVKSYLQNAIEHKTSSTPDIIILDLNLPKISGLQLLKQIKTSSQTAIIPILILTSSISRREMMEAYHLGAAGFIQKSLDFEEYKESIEIMVLYWSKVVALPVQ